MIAGGEDHRPACRAYWLRRPSSEMVYGILLLAGISVAANFVQGAMGMSGLLMLAGGGLAAIAVLFLALKYPVAVAMLWLLSMSGLGTIGMIRMPMIPDFSFPRLFLIIIMIMIPLGVMTGRSFVRAPYWPDILLTAHTAYVLFNLHYLANGSHFHMWYNSNLSPLVGYFFAKQYITNEKNLKIVVYYFAAMSTYFAVTSIAEHFGISALVWPKYIMNVDIGKVWVGRSRGPFLQAALFGQIIGMYLLVNLFLLTRRLSRRWRVAVVANLGFCLLGLLFTYTRGGWLATAAAIVVSAILRPGFRKTVLVVGVVGVLLGAMGLINATSDEFLQERLDNTSTIENRLGFMATAYRMIQERPLFGVGYYRYLELAPLYNQGTNVPFFGYIKRKQGQDVAVHDIFMGRAAEEGMISLVLYLAFFAVCGVEVLKRWRWKSRSEWFDRDFLALIVAIVVAFLVGGLAFDYRYFDLINIIPAFLAGIAVGYPRRAERAPVTTDRSNAASIAESVPAE